MKRHPDNRSRRIRDRCAHRSAVPADPQGTCRTPALRRSGPSRIGQASSIGFSSWTKRTNASLCAPGFLEALLSLAFDWRPPWPHLQVRLLHRQEVLEQPKTGLGQDRFRVKLHSLYAKLPVTKPHDRPVLRLGRNFKFPRQGFSLDDQRMVTRRSKILRQTAKDGLAVVTNLTRLAVHDSWGADHTPAKRFANGLVPKTNAEDRYLSRETLDERLADSRLLRCTWARRDHDALRREVFDFFERNFVVSPHLERLSHLTEVLCQVIRKRIVVIEEQQHRSFRVYHFRGQVQCIQAMF